MDRCRTCCGGDGGQCPLWLPSGRALLHRLWPSPCPGLCGPTAPGPVVDAPWDRALRGQSERGAGAPGSGRWRSRRRDRAHDGLAGWQTLRPDAGRDRHGVCSGHPRLGAPGRDHDLRPGRLDAHALAGPPGRRPGTPPKLGGRRSGGRPRPREQGPDPPSAGGPCPRPGGHPNTLGSRHAMALAGLGCGCRAVDTQCGVAAHERVDRPDHVASASSGALGAR